MTSGAHEHDLQQGPTQVPASEQAPGQNSGHGSEPRSLGEIVGEVTTDLSELFKQELELAKVEAKQEFTRAGKGAGMLAAAGLAGLMVLIFLSMTLMWLLDNVVVLEVAALIVTLLWAAIGAALALIGRKNLQKANPQLPVTQQTIKEDAQWAKHPTS